MSQDAENVHDLFVLILRDNERRETFLNCGDDVAQHLLNLLQDLLDLFSESRNRPLLSQGLMSLFRKSDLHPACFSLADVRAEGYQMAGGGFGDIRQGFVLDQPVAIKIMRVFGNDVKAAAKGFGREAVLWRQLSHPNVLPFLGLYYIENRLCLVSPWMPNGHIVEFLKNAPPDTDRVSLILDIALGLEYLHSERVVHGDLKGENILVTPSLRACVADFGLSLIATTLKFQHATTTVRGGTIRFQAPELLISPEVPIHFRSDIYAFACVCYQILSGKCPYFEVKNDIFLASQVPTGVRPTRTNTISDDLWSLLEDCWKGESTHRPKVPQIIGRLRAPPIAAQEAHTPTDWDETSSARFRRSLQDRLILPPVAEIEQMIFGDGVLYLVILWHNESTHAIQTAGTVRMRL
ncbi:kinase-like domain-containing protein [Mycena galopus ATCC 62051]|nr:kinase-like domain-containing protein [Mycena galopus ATCC 62051]